MFSLSLSLSALSCLCPSLSCLCVSLFGLCSCRFAVGSESCIRSLLSVLDSCASKPLKFLLPNAAHIFPCQSWFVLASARVLRGGVGCGFVVGLGDSRLVILLLFTLSGRFLVLSLDPNIACRKFIHATTLDSLAALASGLVSWLHGGGRLGICCPGSLSFGECGEGCPTRRLGRAAYNVCIYTPEASGSADILCHCMADRCCGGCEDKMDGRCLIAYISLIPCCHNSHGLRYVGDGHSSPLPDRAMLIDTPRTIGFKFNLKFGRRIIDCVMHEHRLHVAKALGHPKPIGVGCPLGEGIGGAIRLTGALGLRVQRPDQQPGEPHSPLGVGISDRGSGEVPPDQRP